jgi:hypothetical protein
MVKAGLRILIRNWNRKRNQNQDFSKLRTETENPINCYWLQHWYAGSGASDQSVLGVHEKKGPSDTISCHIRPQWPEISQFG